MSKVLIVDDTDPAVSYTGSWTTQAFVAANTNEYNSTVHRSTGAGDQLSYTFYGTSVSVYGTVDNPIVNGIPNTSFSIDGLPSTVLNATGNLVIDRRDIATSHTLLFKSSSLTKGSHSLSIKTGTPANAAANLYIDYFVISTGSDSAGGQILVDDRDASIVYSGSWVDNGITAEYLGTTRQSPGVANGGTSTFRFNGTGITIFGTTAASGADNVAQIGFDIDGVRNNTFTGPKNAPAILHTPFFKVDGLANDKEHTVVMNTLTPNVWFLDYMVYKTENSAVAGGGGGSTTGGTTGGATSTGAIAGGVIAAIIGVLAICGIIFILLRRRRMKKEEVDHEGARVKGGTPRPFLVPFSNGEAYAHGQGNGQTQGHDQHHNPNQANPYISAGAHGPIPPSKDSRSRGGGSTGTNTLPQRPDSSSYIGGGSSAYSGIVRGDSQYVDSSLPSSPPAVSPPVHNGVYSGPTNSNPLYPQFDTGAGRGSSAYQPSSHVGGRSPNEYDRTTMQTHSERPRFSHAHNASRSSATHAQDSGIRIPAVSPPLYTAD